MSLELVKQLISAHGVAVINRMEMQYVTGRFGDKLKLVVADDTVKPHITEITETHVIGYRPVDPETPVTASEKYKHPTPFRIKHNGKKFTFGGGSTSCTWNYYFKNVVRRNIVAEAFVAAKELLARNHAENRFNSGTKEEFICHALEKLDALQYPGAAAAINYVHDCFGSTVYSWLLKNAIGSRQYIDNDDHLQAYKHRWLDHVIKQFGG